MKLSKINEKLIGYNGGMGDQTFITDKLYINPDDGTLGTYEEWDYDDGYGNWLNAVDEEKVIPYDAWMEL